MIKVYLDAGHGGKDSGASDHGLLEKDCNLEITLVIDEILRNDYDGVETKMTRTTDVFLSLKERTDAANAWGADYFLSIHCNSNANGNANGFSSYTYITADEKTRAAQNVIHKEIMKMIPDMKDIGQLKGDFHVVRQSHMLAMLTENGFVSSAIDAQKLRSPEFIRRVAEGHAKGIAAFFGLKQKDGVGMDYKGHWAEADIDRVIAEGLMEGYPDGSFKPDQPLTRAQFATVLVKLLDRKV